MGSSNVQGPLWSTAAEVWEEVFEPVRTPLYEAMLDACGVVAGKHLLDAGCGSGAASSRAALRGAIVSGLDAAEGMIERARRQAPDGDFRVEDLEELPFDDRAFDVVVAFDSVQFSEDKVAAIAEMGRVCRPDGTVAIALFDEEEKNEMRVITSAMAETLPEPPKGGPYALSKAGLLEDLIDKAGLNVLGSNSVPLDYRFENFEQFWRGVLSSGNTQAMIRVVGEETIGEAVRAATEPYIGSSGEVLFKNSFRFVTAVP